MSRRRNLFAIVGALAVLVVAAWLDAWLLPRAQRRAAATFDVREVYPLVTVCTVALGGACMLIGWLGSRAAPLVGVLYAVVGVFLASLEWWIFAWGFFGGRTVIVDPGADHRRDDRSAVPHERAA